MDAKMGSQPQSQPLAQSQEALMDSFNRSDMETQELAQTPSVSMSDVVVECPECKRLRDQSEWVHVSSFRPAKFAECIAIVEDVTGAKYPLPHHHGKDVSVDRTYEGYATASQRGDSVSNNSQNDLATIPVPSSGRPLSPPQSSPALCPVVPHSHRPWHHYGQQQPEGQTHDIEGALTQVVENTGIDQHFADGLHSLSSQSLQASQPHQPSDDVMLSMNKPDAVVIQKEEVDQDSISGLFEDMEMADMTISPAATPLPTRVAQAQKHEQEQEAHTTLDESLSVTPTRRRRLILEEESETENEYAHSQQQQEETSPECNLSHEHKALVTKRSRVLQEIRLPLSAAAMEPSLASSPSYSPLVTDATPTLSIDDADLNSDFERPASSAQPVRTRHKLQLRLRHQSAPQSPPRLSQGPGPRRMLQFQGPWHWQVQRRTGPQLQSRSQPSPVVTMAGLSPFNAPVMLPSAPESGVERSKYFTLTQFHTAAPSAYLPLLAYEPRYLKSRRKKSLRDRIQSGSYVSPIVRPRLGQGARTNDPMTPDITSPENSLTTQVSFI
ncbi:hypothetical protein BG011_005270 [Mortierella polycephala]|uniref:Uncharacterized protein n=1 Tax=Mortierella polycephala TaxID=41804 RepID=A0A9P6PW14_9FUNG|nr:hypothetical protein BG011_005270 [Mortierella polycephala]